MHTSRGRDGRAGLEALNWRSLPAAHHHVRVNLPPQSQLGSPCPGPRRDLGDALQLDLQGLLVDSSQGGLHRPLFRPSLALLLLAPFAYPAPLGHDFERRVHAENASCGVAAVAENHCLFPRLLVTSHALDVRKRRRLQQGSKISIPARYIYRYHR